MTAVGGNVSPSPARKSLAVKQSTDPASPRTTRFNKSCTGIVRQARSNPMTTQEAGGLISYGTDIPDLARRSARYLTRVLKGAKPSDLPVEQPVKFELAVNLKTAREMGVTIPQSVLLGADKVIE